MSPAEINDLIRRLRELYTHVETNRRHLHMIEDRVENLKLDIRALLPEEEPEVPVEAED